MSKGAFTGAVSDKLGKVALANGGTLFLDEIGELPLEIPAQVAAPAAGEGIRTPGRGEIAPGQCAGDFRDQPEPRKGRPGGAFSGRTCITGSTSSLFPYRPCGNGPATC